VRRVIDASNKANTYELAAFNPAAGTIEFGLPWPAEIPMKALPRRGPQILIPEQNVSYYSGQVGGVMQLVKYNIASQKWDIQASPNKDWGSGAFIPMGKLGILIMLGGQDGISGEAVFIGGLLDYKP
jgi:hypothetical protein